MDLVAIISIVLLVLTISFMFRSLTFQKRIAEAVEELAKLERTHRDPDIEAHKQRKAQAYGKIPGINA